MLLASLLFLALQNTSQACYCPPPTPLYRYWNPSTVDHFYTTNSNEIGTTSNGQRGKHGYVSEGVTSWVFTGQGQGMVPLYRYWKSQNRDHFYTTNIQEIGTAKPGAVGKHGYKSEGIVGYCYPHSYTGTVPLYRYWKGSVSDHFYTTNINEIGTCTPGRRGKHGYVSEGIQCYVPKY